MRAIYLAFLVACGGEGIHDVVRCTELAVFADECERGCTTIENESGDICQATLASGEPITCATTHTFDGVVGCCAQRDDVFRFAECEPAE